VGTKVTTSLKGSMGERITKALSKVEEKKKKRAIRKAMVSWRFCRSTQNNFCGGNVNLVSHLKVNGKSQYVIDEFCGIF
jgi:hypothetical protein